MMVREVRQTLHTTSSGSTRKETPTQSASSRSKVAAVQRLELTLSPRQAQVLGCRTLGLTVKETAYKLGISINTAKYHAKGALARLGVNNSLAAACLLASRR